MAKTKKVSYAGIPAKNRAQVKRVIETGAFGLLDGQPRTPQKVWAALQEMWAKETAGDQSRETANAKAREKLIKNSAREALEPALSRLADARDMASGIEDGDIGYLEHTVLARCTRLMIEDAGKALEEALRDLTMIPKTEFGYFVDDLRAEAAEPQEVAHGN